jgi:tetratricopeptide (TPR) repeat protein
VSFQLKTLHRAILIFALVGAAVMSLAWLGVRDPRISFLVGDRRAEWILFPSAPAIMSHPAAELDAVFRHQLTLTGQPQTARLSVRAARRVQVRINGREVELGASHNWKNYSNTDVRNYLHAGTNTIEARVFNDNGPAALWLVLETDRITLRSDPTWEVSFVGSAWRPAARATAPRMFSRGNFVAGDEGTFAALAAIWPVWIFFFGLSIVVWVVGRWWFNRMGRDGVKSVNRWLLCETGVPLLIIAALWVALYCNNTGLLSIDLGFDAVQHLGYIDYIQEHKALPLPNEGWEMYQPPLYYGISAVTLSTLGLSANDGVGTMVLRLLTFCFGLAHVVLVFLSLRLLFPAQIGRRMTGLMLAAFLPMQLYLAHYVTNETLMATLAGATIFLCLRLVRSGQVSAAGCAGLGICLGAALLTKVTSVLLAPFIVVVVTARLLATKSALAVWWRTLGVMLVACFAVCGWYYFWIWHHFGTPLIGNWERASGNAWWQDNGYHTLADFTRFGRSLVHPLFSGFAGFADGIYSTLWGDGLCGGTSSFMSRPPWNYDLMAAGYLLALVPALIVLVGAMVSVWRLIRQPSAEWFLLVGFSGTLLMALVFMNLKVPSYSVEKAFFGLCALVPFCTFGAVGWEVLTRGRQPLQFALGVLLLVWAMNSFATVWIRANSAPTHVYLGTVLDSKGKANAALSEFAPAVDIDPSYTFARRFLVSALNNSGQTAVALQQAERAVELNPQDSACHCLLGMMLAGQGQREQAIAEARLAVELDPENLSAYRLYSNLLLEAEHVDEAIAIARNGLVISPDDSGLHYTLGLALTQKNDLTAATYQFAYALLFTTDQMEIHLTPEGALLRWKDTSDSPKHFQTAMPLASDSPLALDKLAWLLATSPDAGLRNGPKAVQLAEHGCTVAGRKDPRWLDTLAAAQAEDGKFPDAIHTAAEALSLARTAGDEATVALTENMLTCFHSDRPFRDCPSPVP